MADSVDFCIIITAEITFGSGLVDETSFDVERSVTKSGCAQNLAGSTPGIGLGVDDQHQADKDREMGFGIERHKRVFKSII